MPRAIRLALPGYPQEGLTDQSTGGQPAAFNGDPLNVEFWLGSVCAASDPFDIDDITSISLFIRTAPDDPDLLTAEIVLPFADLTECTLCKFKEGTGQHGTFELTEAQMSFAPETTQVWMAFRALMTDARHRTFGAGYVTITNGGAEVGPVVNVASNYLFVESVNESDASLTVRFGTQRFEIFPSNLRAIP